MSARSTHVCFRNETPQTLFQTHADLPHGRWRKNQGPPKSIPPSASAAWTAESHGIATGDEGHISFAIGNPKGPANVAFHWDNPYSGHNKYGLTVSPGFQAFRHGGPGDDAKVTVTIRPAVKRETGFTPSVHGFHFHNSWGNVPYSLPPLKGSILDKKYGNAKSGLCGGMVDAARDYFQAKIKMPATKTAPPGEQDPLFRYLVKRIFDTFDVDDVSLYLKYMNPAYPDTDENVLSSLGVADGRAGVVINVEWPIIRDHIDGGQPTPLGLVTLKSLNPGELGTNHQVLAYAYKQDGNDVTLWVYDPNQPDNNDVTIHFQTADWSKRLHIQHNVHVFEDDKKTLRPIYCLFATHYKFHQPPTVSA